MTHSDFSRADPIEYQYPNIFDVGINGNMMNDETYKHYLRDLVYLIKEHRSELLSETQNDNFKKGMEYAYSSILDLIKSQAESFQIELSEFGFDDFEEHARKKQ